VIHKEVVEPHIIREVKPIYEKIVETPTVTKLVKEMAGLNLEEHHRHHSHHALFLAGNQDCGDCRNFHQMTEACQLCRPLHYYEGCSDCGKLRDSGVMLAPFPGSHNLYHTQHHLHHQNVINNREKCYNCTSWHSSQACKFCQPEYYFENCNECNRLRSSGMNLPRFSGMSYPSGFQQTSTLPAISGVQQPYSVTSTTTYVPSGTTFVQSTVPPGTTYVQSTTGLKEGPAATTVSQKRGEPVYKSM